MLLNQTDVSVDEELEKAVIIVYSSTETDMGDNESGYEYSSGETTETSSEIEACLQLGLRMRTVLNSNKIIIIIEYKITKLLKQKKKSKIQSYSL